MSTLHINPKPILPGKFARSSQYPLEDLMLLDVGASGGIDGFWGECFGARLKAVGFDPLIAEVNRLNKSRGYGGIRYEAAFVGFPGYDALFPPPLRQDTIACKNNTSFPQTSAARAAEAMRMNSIKEIYNAGAEVRLTDRHVSLDDYVQESGIHGVDFVKIDTDGHDIEVILGAEKMLRTQEVLGISIESQMHGASHPYSNTFANIDRLLREWGFTLFDLDLWRYSRGSLPDRFYYKIPAQTMTGQIQWGEAVYFRDLARPDYQRMHGFPAGLGKKIKLACLFEIFGLPDCSVEILVQLQQHTGDKFFSTLLDELVSHYRGSRVSYSQFLEGFDADPKRFFPS
jgi:FkbM family methyltransferase